MVPRGEARPRCALFALCSAHAFLLTTSAHWCWRAERPRSGRLWRLRRMANVTLGSRWRWPADGPRRFRRRNSGEALGPGESPQPNASAPGSEHGGPTHTPASRIPLAMRRRRGRPRVPCYRASIACRAGGARAGPWPIGLRFIEQESQSGLFSACSPRFGLL